jgi:hypothetical protein
MAKLFTPQVDIVDTWQGVVIGGKEKVIYIGGEGGEGNIRFPFLLEGRWTGLEAVRPK